MTSRNNRVLLVNSNRMQPPVAPLGLDYLASALEHCGFQVALLDLCFASDVASAIDQSLADGEPLAIGISLRNTDDTSFSSQAFFVPQLKQVVDLFKERTKAPIVLGGAGFSIMPEAVLEYCGLELGIRGDGEAALPSLLESLASASSYDHVPGLVHRSQGVWRRNQPRSYNLVHRPGPGRSLVDNRRYFLEGGMGNIETKRGCPKTCIYCADPVSKGRQVRLRSPAGVADELEALLDMGIDHFHLCDSEFNQPLSHAIAVCQELVRRGLGQRARWYTYASVTPFTEELARLLPRAGCVGINFGADSGSDSMLRALGRDFTVEDLERTACLCRQQGLVFMYDLLLGGPGETRQSLRQTVETMKRLSPHRVGAWLGVRIYPGTALAEMIGRQGPLDQNPNLHGTVAGNQNLLAPVFYLSAEMGAEADHYLAELVAGDERFFVSSRDAQRQSYNYNDNTVLAEAIRAGYRGAFWDILRRLGGG